MKLVWILLFLLVVCACDKKTSDTSVVLARVNEDVLTLEMLETSLFPHQRSKEQIRTYIHDWVNDAIIFQEAKKIGLDKDRLLLNKSRDYFIKLVVSSFLETKTSSVSNLTKESVRGYYKDNISGFMRATDEAVLHHFITDNISEAREIRKKLIRKNSGETIDELFSLYGVDTETVKKGRLIKELDDVIFRNDDLGVMGPIVTNKGFHVIDVLKKNKKGSRIGLEDAYDEIYQRILKQNQVKTMNSLVDSLRKNSKIFINVLYN